MSKTINSNVLTEQNPCINKAIHVVLIHGYETACKIPGGHKI